MSQEQGTQTALLMALQDGPQRGVDAFDPRVLRARKQNPTVHDERVRTQIKGEVVMTHFAKAPKGLDADGLGSPRPAQRRATAAPARDIDS